jgi:hypothetical protein
MVDRPTFSCRGRALARMGKRFGASSAAGWPAEIRVALLQAANRVAACRGLCLKNFGLHARPQPSQGNRRLSDLPCQFTRCSFRVCRGGRTRWVVFGRLRSHVKCETPKHRPPRAGTAFPSTANGPHDRRQASQWATKRKRTITYEPALSIGDKTVTTKIRITRPYLANVTA